MRKSKKDTGFAAISPQVDFPTLEEEILSAWKKNKTFEKSIAERSADKTWTFLDGPPFVTGTPHYGSLLSSIPKDVFGRYWTMKGYRVKRVWGWDGHGLPIENKVETALALKSKKEIEQKVGVKKFIDECKKYVTQVSSEWEWYVDHIGRWVDFKNAYKTWDRDYMESVMWVFHEMYAKGYIYKGFRVTLYCPHCATPISNFETALDNSYKEILDAATTYKYQLKDAKNTFILAWSTTPWNKIVTPALAVNPELTYVKVKQGNEFYILAESALPTLHAEPKAEVVERMKGNSLIGRRFVPHYDYYKVAKGEKAFEVIAGDFVTAEEGTGVVTIAAYGEEDLAVMKRDKVHIEMHLDEEGMIRQDVPKFGGMYYLKANKAVNQDLDERGLIYADMETIHNVPVCWRCGTRLYYAPLDAWFVNVQELKPLLIKTNEEVNWFPKHFKHGRFLKSLENAPDWNISRNRYWGSPVPVWECVCGERFVPGSIKELEEASGLTITDLHKPEIDAVTVTCKKCGKIARRTPEVLDSWIEAGSAAFAERHFPFEAEDKLSDFFPPDFIEEYTGQIRAWFYVMHVIGGALYKSRAFKNVSVTGVILGTDGRKMSKNYGNYPDPKEMISKYGGDALRLYLLGSSVMHGEDILISEEQYRQQVKGLMLVLWNTYNFFISYAGVDGWTPKREKANSENVLDRWILSLLSQLVSDVTDGLDAFDTVLAIGKLRDFVTDFSTWYIRRSRDRTSPSANDAQDTEAFYNTCYEVLLTLSKLFAPLIPFLSDAMYRNLTGDESVHLVDWPKADILLRNKELEVEMQHGRDLASGILMRRKMAGVKVRMPIKELKYRGPCELQNDVLQIVKEEVNVQNLLYEGAYEQYVSEGKPEELTDPHNQDAALGAAREIIRQIQEARKNLGTSLREKIVVSLPSWPAEHEAFIKTHALIQELHRGEFKVDRIS